MNNDTENSPIHIDLSMRGTDDAARLMWYSDDMQASMDGGALEQTQSLDHQALEFARELMAQGHDGTGTIKLHV